MTDPPIDGQSYSARYRRAKKQTDADMRELEILKEMRQSEDFSFGVENQNPWSGDDFVESCGENVVEDGEYGYSSNMQIGSDTPDTAADVNEGDTFSNDLHDTSESDNDNYLTNADTDDLPMAAKIATWANEFNISHAAINSLLKILKPSFSDLPTDATTLLQSPRSYAVKTFSSGQYFHFGIAHGLEPMLSRLNLSTIQEVLLQFNVDGLPLCRSSNSQCWPIVCLIRKSPSKDPFVVGLFWAISLQLV